MSWLDAFFAAYYSVNVNGVALPQERTLALVGGANVTLSATDLPLAGQTQVTVTASGSGGGGWTYNATATSVQSLTAATWQIQPVNSTGGTFQVNLPTSGLSAGQRVDIKDVGATSATTGIYTNAVTISGGTKYVQNPHTSSVSATSYAFGGSSGDGGGSVLSLMYNGTGWMVIQ